MPWLDVRSTEGHLLQAAASEQLLQPLRSTQVVGVVAGTAVPTRVLSLGLPGWVLPQYARDTCSLPPTLPLRPRSVGTMMVEGGFMGDCGGLLHEALSP